jgi:pimeloyl-ACP methyl ester carboxylesterase
MGDTANADPNGDNCMTHIFRCGILTRISHDARRIAVGAWAVALGVISVPVAAEEVSVRHKELTLNANLELAANKKLSDGVILITHGGLAHRGMEIIVYLQHLLKEKNYNTLAINLSLGLNDRRGMYDCSVAHRHRNEDAAEEIGVWLDWLEQRGASHVILLGHSRGGAQTALFAAEHDHPLVKAAVLLAPATRENGADGYEQRYGKPLSPLLARAQTLVNANKGNTLLEHVGLLTCGDTSATARSFVSYYAASERLDTPSLLPKFKKPVLVVVAGDDEIVVSLAPKIAPLADGTRVKTTVIDGADHFFRDLYTDDAVDAMVAFLGGVR